jgi:hypothetical protein
VITEDRNSRKIIAEAKEGETSALFVLVALMAAILLAFSLWLLPRPADAARRAVFKGTVTICYAPSAKSDPFGQYLSSQWNLDAAVRAAGPSIGRVRVVKERWANSSCYGQVRVASAPDAYYNGVAKPGTPSQVWKLIDSGMIWQSQISMGDKVGAKGTNAQRQAWLAAALKVAIPR